MSGSGPGSASSTRVPAAEEGGERRRVLDRRREPDPAQPRRQPLQPREAEHQLVAALAIPPARGSRRRRPGRPRRRCAAPPGRRASAPATPAWSAGCAAGRPAGARARRAPVSPVRSSTRIGEPHLGDRRPEVAADVGGERLQRRDVEGVQPRRRARPRARSGSAGSRPASCRRRSARSAASRARRRGRSAPAGAGAAPSRAGRTSRRSGSGRVAGVGAARGVSQPRD